jgi:peroxiredoxin
VSGLKNIVFCVVVVAMALSFALRKPTSTLVNVGDEAPEFTVTAPDGKTISVIKDETGRRIKLSDYRGSIVFLNFWFTTCRPCRAEMPDMEIVNRAFKGRKFKMIPISVDADFDDVKKFYEEFQLTSMPMYADPGKRIASRYNVYAFPETFIIDGNGLVLKHYIGGRAWSNAKHRTELEEWVKKQDMRQSASH